MRKIPLRKVDGTVRAHAIVDDEDYERVNKLKWSCGTNGYASNGVYIRGSGRKNQKMKCTTMHRFILRPKKGEYVDHINGDKLDNRKINLRICTQSQNCCNCKITTSVMGKETSSGFKGVCFDKGRGLWESYIWKNRKKYHLGRFEHEEDAADQYNIAAQIFFGEFSYLNPV